MEQLARIHGTINKPGNARTTTITALEYNQLGRPTHLPVHIATVNGTERYGLRKTTELDGWLVIHLWNYQPAEYLRQATVLLEY